MAKRLGTDQNNKDSRLNVECLKGLGDHVAAEKVALHFSSISQDYPPLNVAELPAYLPAQEVLKVDEYQVAERIYKLKSRKSTQPGDIPSPGN